MKGGGGGVFRPHRPPPWIRAWAHLSHGPCDGPKQDTSYSVSEERVIAVPLEDTGPQASYCYEVGFEIG